MAQQQQLFWIGAFTTTATAETIVTADVLNVRENRLQNQKWSKSKEWARVKSHKYRRWLVKIELNGKSVCKFGFTKDVYHVTANLLNVRTEANTDSEILGRLKKMM